jgi:Tfp pilus assembly protein PilZ
MSAPWCPVCNTRHVSEAECPGELNATGPERHGWRVTVETSKGIESYGVLIAPCRDVWRARILTYPNVLWLVPGGRTTVKFASKTPEEVERLAINFIEEHCQERGFRRRDQMVPVDAGAVNPEGAEGGVAGTAPGMKRRATAPRRLRSLPVRFGPDRATMLGSTADLSEEGMFVMTPVPLEAGTSVLLHLELVGTTVPLQGLVMWNRVRREPGRPVGMGVRIINAPQVYLNFVKTLR